MWHLTKIPKIVHFYWGNEKLSYLRYLSVLSFRKLNPTWEIKVHIPAVLSTAPPLWDTEHQKNINITEDYFDQLNQLNVEIIKHDFSEDFDNTAHEVHKSDFLRWKILSSIGGVWSDIDILYVNPMDNLLENRDELKNCELFLCPYKENGKHTIGFLMSSPDNVFFKEILDLAKINYVPNRYQCIGSELIMGK